MNSSTLKKRGGGYIQYKHCLIWQGLPIHENILSKKVVKQLMKDNDAWMLRNCYDWDCGTITNFWELICDEFYSMENLPSKTRNQIRRCLRDCNIRMLSARELINNNGYNVYKEAFKRYRDIAITILDKQSWEASIRNDNIHEFWGVFEKCSGDLIAWSMNTVDKQRVQYNTLKAIPSMMNKHYPYFGLLHEMNRYYLNEMGYAYVSDGWRTVTGHSGIQPFLEKNFRFRKAYVKMNLHYIFWLKIMIRLLFPIRHWKILPPNVRNVLKFEEINRQCY